MIGGDQGGGGGLRQLDVVPGAGVVAALGQVQGGPGHGDGQLIPQVGTHSARGQGRDELDAPTAVPRVTDVGAGHGMAQSAGDDGVGGLVADPARPVDTAPGIRI